MKVKSLSIGSFFVFLLHRFDFRDHLCLLFQHVQSSNSNFLFLPLIELVGIQTKDDLYLTINCCFRYLGNFTGSCCFNIESYEYLPVSFYLKAPCNKRKGTYIAKYIYILLIDQLHLTNIANQSMCRNFSSPFHLFYF